MGLINAIGLQPRHPAPTVTSQGTQTQTSQLQNAETQTDHDLPDNPQQPRTSQGSQVTDGQTSLLSSGEVCHWDEKTNQSLVSFSSLCSDILIAPLCSWLQKYSVSIKYSFNPLDSLTNLNKINLTGDSIFNFYTVCTTNLAIPWQYCICLHVHHIYSVHAKEQHLVSVLP